MKEMLVVMMLINGQPNGDVIRLETIGNEPGCRTEMMMINGINRAYRELGIDFRFDATCVRVPGTVIG